MISLAHIKKYVTHIYIFIFIIKLSFLESKGHILKIVPLISLYLIIFFLFNKI